MDLTPKVSAEQKRALEAQKAAQQNERIALERERELREGASRQLRSRTTGILRLLSGGFAGFQPNTSAPRDTLG